jgi:hypothetical protein
MAEQREKLGSVLLRIGSKDRKGRILEVYSAEQWPEQREADTGLYRVRINKRWVSIGGQKYTFFTPEQLGQVIAKELTTPGALVALERPAPDFRKGQWVSWRKPSGASHTTKLASDPVLWVDGQWRVLISDYKHGVILVCCDELVSLDRFGREVR